jgi:hypothetical protein
MTHYIQNYMDISVNIVENIQISQVSNSHLKFTVFDFDETIGNFGKLSSFLTLLRHLIDVEEHFFKLMDQFQEVFRPGIFEIFELLLEKREKGLIDGVLLYTNNCSGKDWVDKIINYIHHKLGAKLFDDIIYTYIDVKGQIVDNRRNTQKKTKNDLLNCICHQIFMHDSVSQNVKQFAYVDKSMRDWLNRRLIWKTKLTHNCPIVFYFFDDVNHPEMNDDVNQEYFTSMINYLNHHKQHNLYKMPITHTQYYMVDKYLNPVNFKDCLLKSNLLKFKDEEQKKIFSTELDKINDILKIKDDYICFLTINSSKIIDVIKKI